MRLIFIGNPISGKHRAHKHWSLLEENLAPKKWDYKIYWSAYAGHAIALAQQAVHENPDIIVALGGDGTVHEVLKGMYHQDKKMNIPFTVFPVGTGNDWARYWHIPHTAPKWIDMIERKKIELSDLGHIEYMGFDNKTNTSVFNNVAGMAYDGYVADIINKSVSAKGNKLIYLFYIFKCLLGYKLQKSKISVDRKVYEDHFYTINIGVCPYSGGGLHLVPHANPTDGLLALTAVKPLSLWQVLIISRHFYTGLIHKHKKAIAANSSRIEIEPLEHEIIKLEADGEVLGKLPATFTILQSLVKVYSNK